MKKSSFMQFVVQSVICIMLFVIKINAYAALAYDKDSTMYNNMLLDQETENPYLTNSYLSINTHIAFNKFNILDMKQNIMSYGLGITGQFAFTNKFIGAAGVHLSLLEIDADYMKGLIDNFAKQDAINIDLSGDEAKKALDSLEAKKIYFVPFNFSILYNIAPYGGCKPYFGIGALFSYIKSYAPELELKSQIGMQTVFGVNFVSKNYSVFSIDVTNSIFKIASKISFNDKSFEEDSKIISNVLMIGLSIPF